MEVSVIIPVYNVQETIEDCISSLLSQSLSSENYEIIVVDNNSTDNTKRIIKKLPVRYVYEAYPSVYKARNTGVAFSSGDIIAFIDGDCIADKDWLPEGINVMQTYEIAAGKINPLSAKKNYLYYYDLIVLRAEPEKINKDINICAGNFFVSRKLFEELGGFKNTIVTAGDSLLSMEAKKRGYPIGFAPRAIVYHPVDPFRIRFGRCFREGKGAILKDNYKLVKAYKHAKLRLYLSKILNFIRITKAKLVLVKEAYQKKHISSPKMIILSLLVILFVINEYAGVVVAKYFRNLNSLLAIR